MPELPVPRLCIATGLAVLLAVVSPALAVAGEPPIVTPTPSPPYSAPRVSPDYLKAMVGQPDWNGIWSPEGYFMFDAENAIIQPRSKDDIGGADFGPPAGSYNRTIPYRPEYRAQYDVAIKRALAGENTDNVGNCMRPHGVPRQMGASPGPIEIFMLPTQVRMTWAWMNATRRIFTDGRPHPGIDESYPTYMGHSVGHWEGDTLVIETTALYGGFYDQSAAPYSDQTTVVERLRLIGKDQLEDMVTVTDPVMLTKPWTTRHTFKRIPEDKGYIMGNYCPPEGNSVDVSGGFERAVLPTERDAASQPSPPPKAP